MLRTGTWLLALLVGVCVSRPVRADDQRTQETVGEIRAYPSSKPELERWLSRYMLPGKTRPRDVVAIFGPADHDYCGPGYRHIVYRQRDLHLSGCQAAEPVLVFLFDERTGKLDYAGMEDVEERQTGYHPQVQSEQ